MRDPKMFLKGETVAIIKTFGAGMLLNEGDLGAALRMFCEFPMAPVAEAFCDQKPIVKRLRRMVESIVLTEKHQRRSGIDPIVFLVAPADYVTKKWFRILRIVLQKKLPGVPIYSVVFGGYFPGSTWREEAPYSGEEVCAHEVGCVKLYLNSNAISNGFYRLVEFMNRVMGRDVYGPRFPDYVFEDLKKMAWHISRENFNMGNPREGAIPKYEISPETGRPIFPF